MPQEEEFLTFLSNPLSIYPQTPRSYISQYLRNTRDLTNLLKILPSYLSGANHLSPSLITILTPNSESSEAYLTRVLLELDLLKYTTPMTQLIRDERKKSTLPLSSLDRWSRTKQRSLSTTYRSLAPQPPDLNILRSRVNEKFLEDERDRVHLDNFLRFRQNRNDFFLRQQRFEEAQVRDHVRELRKQLAREKTRSLHTERQSLAPQHAPTNTPEEAEKRKFQYLAEKSHKALEQRLKREWRVGIRKQDYAKALDAWKQSVRSGQRSST